MPLGNNFTAETRFLGLRGAAQYLIQKKPQFERRDLEEFIIDLDARIAADNGPAHEGHGEQRRFSYHDLDAWAETQGS